MGSGEAEAGGIDNTFKIQGQDFVAGSSGGPRAKERTHDCGGRHGLYVHTRLSSRNHMSYSSLNLNHLLVGGPAFRRGHESVLGQSEPFPGISPIRTKGMGCFPL